jgi:hypothetical protein
VVNKILEAQGAKDKFVTLGRFPKHQAHFDGDFVRLCKAVVFEGCINETVAAAHLLHASILCTNDSLKQILYHIAEQEWGHALFAFDCFHWMMSQFDLETRKLIQVEIENNLKEEVAKAKNMTKAQISIHQLGVLSDSKERFVRTQVIHKVLIPEFLLELKGSSIAFTNCRIHCLLICKRRSIRIRCVHHVEGRKSLTISRNSG